MKNTCGDGVDFRVVFYQKKISSLFSFKDQYSIHYANNVVYRINCPDCNSVYVGETSRRLTDRFKEHLMKSFGGQKGVIYQHCSENNHNFPEFLSHCSVLGNESKFYRRKIRESLTIKSSESSLNGNVASHPLELF